MSRVAELYPFSIAVLLTAIGARAPFVCDVRQSKTVTIQGTVKDSRWNNPHVFIQLLVKNDAGVEEEWSIEMTTPEHLARVGWKPGSLKPGDKVTLNIHPMHDGSKGGQYLSGTGPDGPLIGSPPEAKGESK
jgi:hypothetical protein